MPIPISIRDLSKTYRTKRGTVHAVDKVSLDIAPGELFFLLGPSGCGKTTLLRMIAGFITPNTGTIRFAERDITHHPPNKRNTGMVFQSYALWPHMTVAQNVAFGLTVRKIAGEEKSQAVRKALQAVQLLEYADRKPNELSGGQQQRVALARALVIRPDVLLLDEPLSNLDARLRADLRTQVRRICKDAGITSVYVTHDQAEALSMADRIAIMRHGRIEQIGTPAELYETPRSAFVATFLGDANLIDATVTTPDTKSESPTKSPITNTSKSPQAEIHRVRVTTPIGEFAAKALKAWHPSTRAQIVIRPEALRVCRTGNGSTMHARVVESQYLGSRTILKCQVADTILQVEAPSLHAPEDSEVHLTIDTDRVILVESEAHPYQADGAGNPSVA